MANLTYKDSTLYIAYGSNMNIEQMVHRCRTAKVIGTSVLKGYRLLFRGEHEGAVATVEPSEGDSVPVVVWEITPNDEAALDRYEGFPTFYRKETVLVEVNCKPTEAMIYIMNIEDRFGNKRELGNPSPHYYASIRDGYKAAGFDLEILRSATVKNWDFEDDIIETPEGGAAGNDRHKK